MAETAQKTGTPRRGQRRAASAAAAKTTTENPAPVDDEVTRIAVEFEKVGETKNYSKWCPPEGVGCTGSLYAPLGATAVTVEVSGPA